MTYKDPQKEREYQKKYRRDNSDADRLRHKVHRQAHPEITREYDKVSRQRHREKRLAYAKTYYREHRVVISERNKSYVAAHRAMRQAVDSRRSARKRALPATLTTGQWQAILVAYKRRCAYCGRKPKKLTQDHVIPVSKGGGTTPDNIVPACSSCNASKQAGPPPVVPPVRLLI